jgi:DNA-binding MarR family transcriptional regulator
MDDGDKTTRAQAKGVVDLLPAIMRQLFAGADDPTEELPLAQLRVCNILQHGARSMSALSREIGVTLSALTQIADRLERAGLVHRVAEENDRRIRCLQLTPQGEKIMQLQASFRVQRVSDALNCLSAAERTAVLGALESLLGACIAVRDQQAAVSEPKSPLVMK